MDSCRCPDYFDRMGPLSARVFEHVDVHAFVVAAIRRFGGDTYDLPHGRIVFTADGEDLAEGFVEEWLACMAPALAHYGLVLTVESVDSPLQRRTCAGASADYGDYILMINGVRCQVWDAAEWDLDAEPPWDPWLAATLRPLAVINALLAARGSRVRAHTIDAGGNDGVAIPIEPGVVAAMRQCGDYPDSAVPVLVPDSR